MPCEKAVSCNSFLLVTCLQRVSVLIFWILVTNFWRNNFLLVFQPVFYHRSIFFYLRRSCRGGTPAAGTTRTELFLERGERARVFTGKLYPPAQKKEARKGPGNRLHVRYASKTRFLLPTLNYCKRDRTSAIHYGSIIPFDEIFCRPLPPALTPALFFFVKNIAFVFFLLVGKKLDERWD